MKTSNSFKHKFAQLHVLQLASGSEHAENQKTEIKRLVYVSWLPAIKKKNISMSFSLK